jgi:type II secretory pathway component PulF
MRVLADLAPLLIGKVPIDRALRIVAAQQRGKIEKSAAQKLEASLKNGMQLSQAFAQNEEFFGTASVAAARAGEYSGSLAESLGKYVAYLQRQAEMRRRIFSSLAYPAAVAVVAIVAAALLFYLVIPRLGALLEALGGMEKAPLPTQILLSFCHFTKGPVLPLCGLAGLILIVTLSIPLGKGSLFMRLMKKLPLIGAVVQLGALSRATATLASLLKAGVPLPEALHLCGPASGNERLAELFEKVAGEVEHGIPLSVALDRQKWMALRLVAEVAALGEETGALPEQMEWVSRELESQTSTRSSTLMSLLEPALIVAMAMVVALVAAALFMPVLSLANRIGG